MKSILKSIRNLAYVGLIGASSLVASGAEKARDNKPQTTYDLIKEGLPSNIGVTTTKFGIGFDKKPTTYTQTPFVVIPPMTDLKISSDYTPIRQSDYDNLINNKDIKEVKPNKEGLTEFAERIRPNLATIIRSYWSTNDSGERTQNLSGAGSGTIISQDGFLLTVDHVTEGNTNKYTALSFSKDGKVRLSPLKVVAYSPKRDASLCKLEGNFPDITPLGIRENHILPNETVIGLNLEYGPTEDIDKEITSKEKIKRDTINPLFPLVRQDENGNISIYSLNETSPILAAWIGAIGNGRISPIDLAMRQGRLNEFQKEQEVTTGKKFEYLVPVYNALSNPGNSGSATFDTSGNILGLISAGHEKENKTLMVSPHTLRELITKYKSQEPKKSN